MTAVARSLIESARALRHVGRVRDAAAAYDDAVVACRAAADPLLLGHTLRHLADLCLELGQPTRAYDAISEVLAIYEREPSVPVLERANAIRIMALVEDTRDVAAARDWWRAAAQLYGAVGVEAGVAECMSRLNAPAAGEPETPSGPAPT